MIKLQIYLWYKKSEESKMKPKPWMVKKGASENFDEISFVGGNSISRSDLLKYVRSNFERLSLKNIESLQENILPMQEEISEILENEVKM